MSMERALGVSDPEMDMNRAVRGAARSKPSRLIAALKQLTPGNYTVETPKRSSIANSSNPSRPRDDAFPGATLCRSIRAWIFKVARLDTGSGEREGFKPSHKLQKDLILAVALGAAFALAECTGQPLSTREKGTLGGGVLGASTGAIIGAAVGHPAAGAAIGGALGAGTGYVVGNALQNQEVTSHQQQGQIQYQQREIQTQRRQIQQLQEDQATE